MKPNGATVTRTDPKHLTDELVLDFNTLEEAFEYVEKKREMWENHHFSYIVSVYSVQELVKEIL